MAETPVMADHETIKRVQANYRIARANLLARIMPATDYQRRGAGHA
jgi:hypothetical protein